MFMTIHQLHLFSHKKILDSLPDHIICLLMVVEDKQIWKLGSWAELSPKVHHWHCPHCNPSLPCLSPCFCLKTNCKLSTPMEIFFRTNPFGNPVYFLFHIKSKMMLWFQKHTFCWWPCGWWILSMTTPEEIGGPWHSWCGHICFLYHCSSFQQ